MKISLFNIEKTTFQNSSKQTEYSGMPLVASCFICFNWSPIQSIHKEEKKEETFPSIIYRLKLKVIISLLQFVRR